MKKIGSFKIEDLEDEALDVLITLLLTLKASGVESLDKVVSRKIENNISRGYK